MGKPVTIKAQREAVKKQVDQIKGKICGSVFRPQIAKLGTGVTDFVNKVCDNKFPSAPDDDKCSSYKALLNPYNALLDLAKAKVDTLSSDMALHMQDALAKKAFNGEISIMKAAFDVDNQCSLETTAGSKFTQSATAKVTGKDLFKSCCLAPTPAPGGGGMATGLLIAIVVGGLLLAVGIFFLIYCLVCGSDAEETEEDFDNAQ